MFMYGKVLGCLHGLIIVFMRDNGRMVKCMVKVL